MLLEDVIFHYRFLYHVAERDSWPSIRKNGLRSTSALLDLYEIPPSERIAIEASRRPEQVTITHPRLPPAVIRDNRPLSDSKLRKALVDGTTTEEWYRLLSGKVFFWLTERRLVRFLSAAAYRNRPHVVIKVRSADLLLRYEAGIWLTPMNTGSTEPFPHPRGLRTFHRIRDFPFEERRKVRSLDDTVVELAVDGIVKDIERIVENVEEWQADRRLRTVWAPS